ncbi:uncharacterized protein LOC134288256 [Aedes albopictus]|uniref:PHD-type domain-containing protein n=1 Tax=Aedes albopictus TaxID=7160 RepID=A0ABM1XMB0_AEDAL
MSSRTLRSNRSGKPNQVVGAKNSANSGVQVVVTGDPEESHPGRTCQVCRGMDTDEMVQCDDCQKWHHFQCVGVTQQIENFPWSCAKCGIAKGVQESISTAGAHQGSGGVSVRLSEVDLNSLPVLPHQQVETQPQTSRVTDGTIQKKDVNKTPFVTSLRWVVNTSREPSRNASRASSVSSSHSSQALAKLKLQKLEELRTIERREAEQQRALVADEAKKEKAYLDQKYHLLEQAMSESGSSRDDSVSRTEHWVASTSQPRLLNTGDQLDLNQRFGKIQLAHTTSVRVGSSRSSLPEPNPPDPFPVPESLLTYSVDPPATDGRMQPLTVGSVNPVLQGNQTEPVTSMEAQRRVSIAQTPHSGAYGVFQSSRSLDATRSAPHSALRVQPRNSVSRNPEANQPCQFSQGVSTPEYQQFAPHPIQSRVHLPNAPHSSTMRASRVYDHEEDMDPCPISRKQLAARQAITKDLPAFSGNPEEWPLFFSTFNSTTTLCGFTNEENIVRLQRSLKGRAYEAVKSRLLHPANVNGVISTLKMLFGQPELIVHTMMSKINSLPSLREDKLEALVDFAVSVENFCATADACGLEEYLYNISFLHQLVSKLPPSIKLNWAQYRRTLPTVNLSSFSNWLYSLAEAASAITIPNVTFESKTVRSDSRTTKRNNPYVNAHSEEASSGFHSAAPSNVETATGRCPVCEESCTSIAKCKGFLELSRDARWATVRDLGLCRRCLRQHKGWCQAKQCGKNGCELKHHELLHNEQKGVQLPSTTSSKNPNEASPAQGQYSTPHPVPSSSEHGCHAHQVTSSQVLFRYLPIVLHGKYHSIQTFAFLDDGSELTLLDNELADELQLEGEPMPLCLHWTGGAKRREEESRSVKLEVSAKHNESKTYSITGVRTVAELLLPSQTLNLEELSQRYPHLKGLPISSYQNVRPRILIGMKDQHLSLVQKSREGALHQPIAVKTRLGWTVCGGGNQDNSANLAHSVFHVCACDSLSDVNLHQKMKEYFAVDSLGVAQPLKTLRSTEEERAISLLEARTVFKGDRYETGLLWRYDNPRLPDSLPMALQRLQCLKKGTLES